MKSIRSHRKLTVCTLMWGHTQVILLAWRWASLVILSLSFCSALLSLLPWVITVGTCCYVSGRFRWHKTSSRSSHNSHSFKKWKNDVWSIIIHPQQTRSSCRHFLSDLIVSVCQYCDIGWFITPKLLTEERRFMLQTVKQSIRSKVCLFDVLCTCTDVLQ